MPQLIPFYFVNQISFIFITILISLYVVSKFIIPYFVYLFVSRTSINEF